MQGRIQCMDAIKASMADEEFKGFLKGNAIKYIWNYEKQIDPLGDLYLAKIYLGKLISAIEESGL